MCTNQKVYPEQVFPYSAIQYVSHDYAKKRLYAADPRQVARLRPLSRSLERGRRL